MAPKSRSDVRYRKPKIQIQSEKRITRSQVRLDPSLAPKPIPNPPKPDPKWVTIAMQELAAREPEKGQSRRKLSEMVRNATVAQRARWRELSKKK